MGLLFSLLRVFYVAPYPVPKPGANIVITGCDTGFGRMTAVQLSRFGYKVFALTYKAESIAGLQAEANTSNLVCLQCDVTKDDDIKRVVASVEQQSPEGLNGLINNAGINAGSFIDWSSDKDFRNVMEVNYFAMVNVTKAFLPLLRKQKGKSRIINITSVVAFLPLAGIATYTASKHAAQAFSDVLRQELAPWRIPVIVIQPGCMKTPLVSGGATAIETAWKNLDQAGKDVYGEEFFQAYNKISELAIAAASNPQVTVDAMIDAFLSPFPKQVYRVGYDHYVYSILRHSPHFVQNFLLQCILLPSVKPITAF